MAVTKQQPRAQRVDIEAVFRSKNARMAALMPGFVFRYLKRIIHEKDINDFLEKHGHLQDYAFIEEAMKEFDVSIEVHGLELTAPDRKYIFVANHPLGGFDGLMLMHVLHTRFRELKFLVNDILMNISNLGNLFIPINKHGKQAVEAVKQIDAAFASGDQILTFPAGYVSRKIRGRVMDLPWQKSFVQKSVQFRRDVVPVHISGRNTDFFYRLANLRKFLGIKANLEMFYLVDETWKHKNKHLVLTFGEPIPWQTFDKSKKPAEWALWVKTKLYSMAGIDTVPL